MHTQNNNVDVLKRIVDALCAWSGVTDDTPDDSEVLYAGPGDGMMITMGDLRDAYDALENLKNPR